MKLAYVISAYHLPTQLVRLVERLQSPNASFYIHVDAKAAPGVMESAVRGLRHHGNVTFLERHVCHYLGFGHVEASLKGIHAIIESGDPCDYALLLTGQDYPIKPPATIEAFFEAAQGKSFMQNVAMSDPEVMRVWSDAPARFRHWQWRWMGRDHYLPPDHVDLRRVFSISGGPVGWALQRFMPPRDPPPGGAPWGGGGYWNLSRVCIEYVDDFVRANPAFVRYFRTIRIPDEHFFQTALMNSPLASGIVSEQLRYIDWEGATGSSPRTLGLRDFDRLATSAAPLARKFNASEDGAILDLIDGRLLSRTQGDWPVSSCDDNPATLGQPETPT